MNESMEIRKGDRNRYPVRLLSIDGAARYLSCCADLGEDLIALGEVPVIRLGTPPPRGRKDRRKRYVDRNDLDELIESRKKRIGDRG